MLPLKANDHKTGFTSSSSSTTTIMGKKPQKQAGGGKKGGNAKGKKATGGGGKAKKPSAKAAKKVSQTIAAQQQRKPQQQQATKSKHSSSSANGASKLSQMQEAMRRRLDGGKFRMLNEQLYTTTGASAFSTFQSEPELFDVVRSWSREASAVFFAAVVAVADVHALVRSNCRTNARTSMRAQYHQGFREMAEKWPVNPLDTFINYVKCALALRSAMLCMRRIVC